MKIVILLAYPPAVTEEIMQEVCKRTKEYYERDNFDICQGRLLIAL